MNDVASIIDATVRERFGDDVIDSVSVAPDADSDGDRVLVVQVVFNGPGPLETEKTATIIRHIRSRLREQAEEAFPIVSFTSRSEARDTKPAAA